MSDASRTSHIPPDSDAQGVRPHCDNEAQPVTSESTEKRGELAMPLLKFDLQSVATCSAELQLRVERKYCTFCNGVLVVPPRVCVTCGAYVCEQRNPTACRGCIEFQSVQDVPFRCIPCYDKHWEESDPKPTGVSAMLPVSEPLGCHRVMIPKGADSTNPHSMCPEDITPRN